MISNYDLYAPATVLLIIYIICNYVCTCTFMSNNISISLSWNRHYICTRATLKGRDLYIYFIHQ